MQELAYERISQHRALAERVIYNRNWLPRWLVTTIVSDFCDQGERYLREEGLPPLAVRLWWAYKHWRFLRNASAVDARKKSIWKQSKKMLREHHRSAIRESAGGIIHLNGMPVARSAPIPNGLGDYPRPDCPKCHTPNPQLGTPLDPKSPSGWGDSYFTCSNYKCRHTWKWKKVFPGLEENKNKEGTVTGAKLKGTDIPFYLFGKAGCTVEQANEAIKNFAHVACLANLTPEQRLQIVKIQAGEKEACKQAIFPLAKVTPNRETLEAEHRLEIWESNNGR